ncbi:hypothetical protein GCM10022284_37630 [Streptomyces hundungensis]
MREGIQELREVRARAQGDRAGRSAAVEMCEEQLVVGVGERWFCRLPAGYGALKPGNGRKAASWPAEPLSDRDQRARGIGEGEPAA